MNYSSLYGFLSEQNVKNHLSYMRTLKLKYSILEKSIPQLKGKDAEALLKSNLPKKQIGEALPLLLNIKAHELYFSSFTDKAKPSKIIRKHYTSENSFCYQLAESAKRLEYGYLYIFKDLRGRPCFKTVTDLDRSFVSDKPILLVDLAEHAYFADYGFEYGKYLKGAISHLDFSKLTS